MRVKYNRAALLLVGVLTCLSAGGISAGGNPAGGEDVFRDRSRFFPHQEFDALPAKVVGVLAGDSQAVTTAEGRRGPADAFGFSRGGGSYLWVYVSVPDKPFVKSPDLPVSEKPLIGALNIPVGDGKEKKTQRFNRLSMANPKTVKPWGVTELFTLVEVEVNGGLGSPAGEVFVATQGRVVEGSKEYPLKVAEVIAGLRKDHQAGIRERQTAIDAAMAEVQLKALQARKPTGPRETGEVVYVTWLPETERLSVRLKTRISDGLYQEARPAEPARMKNAALPTLPAKDRKARFGMTFGVELGTAYEVSKTGRVERRQTLPIESFQKEIPPPTVPLRPADGELKTADTRP